jgi:hypothetical protein
VTVTPSDEEFLEFVSQALRVLERQADEVARGEIEVGLIAAGKATAMAQLKALAEEWAHQRAKHETFGAVLRPGVVGQELRTRLGYVERVVALAIEHGAPDLGGVGQTAHALLSVLRVWCPSVGDDGADLRAVLDQLRPIADGYENTTPLDLFGHLERSPWDQDRPPVWSMPDGSNDGYIVGDSSRSQRTQWRSQRKSTLKLSSAGHLRHLIFRARSTRPSHFLVRVTLELSRSSAKLQNV